MSIESFDGIATDYILLLCSVHLLQDLRQNSIVIGSILQCIKYDIKSENPDSFVFPETPTSLTFAAIIES
jgi:hypothetical protein